MSKIAEQKALEAYPMVKESVQEYFDGNEMNLKITIIDCYITTDCEV